MSTEEAQITSEGSANFGDSRSEMETRHLFTPTQPSSVFLTPPSSSRKPPAVQSPVTPRTPTMNLAVLSPALTPHLCRPHPRAQGYLPDSSPPPTLEFLDVLGSLYVCGRGHISETILFLLDPPDLCRCMQVCSLWRQMVSSNDRLMDVVTAFRRRCRDNAENKEKNHKDPVLFLEPRRALSTLATANMQPPPARPLASSSLQPHPTSKLRPCPNCQSPAKELNLRRAECTKCHFDFCQSCFNRWHGEALCTRSRSPKKSRESAGVLCGTKKSRKRLKRL